MGEMPLSLNLDAATKERLEREARFRNMSAGQIAEEAVRAYVEIQEHEREVLKARLAEADRGVFISGEAMHRWIESWGTEQEVPPPGPDVFPRK